METAEDNRLLVIAGPTASGKTRLAVEFAETLGGEVISADSIQVYRRLDIGSAKPTPEERRGIAHHLLDVADLHEPVDAARYADLADRAIREVRSRGKVPIVAGGTGLYLRGLLRGLAAGIASDPDVRARLNARAALGTDELRAMHAELTRVDPAYAARIAATDPIRIVRALEVYETTGETLTEHHARHAREPPRYESLVIALDVPRDVLRARIETRAREMLERGLIDEVRGILADGFDPALKPLRSVGYAEAVQHVLRGVPLDETLRDIVRATAAFAKRQGTWFRGQEREAVWATPDEVMGREWRARVERFITTRR